MDARQPKFDFGPMAKLENDSCETAENDLWGWPLYVGDVPPSENWEKPERDRARDDLIKEVRAGRIEPDDAETYTFGPDPIIQKPYVCSLSHPELDRWSIEMVAAWILWGTAEAVCRHVEFCYSDASVWVETAFQYSPKRGTSQKKGRFLPRDDWRSGYEPVELQRTTIWSKFRSFSGKEESFTPFELWLPELRGYLTGNRISAWGTRLGEDKRKKILPRYWETASLQNCTSNGTLVTVGDGVSYRDVTFSREEVMQNVSALRTSPSHQRLVIDVSPWIKNHDQTTFRKNWHKALYELLRQQCPEGLPYFVETRQVRMRFMWSFLKQMEKEQEAGGKTDTSKVRIKRLREAIAGGEDGRNADQCMERFLVKLFEQKPKRAEARFGKAMLAAIPKEIL